MVHMHNRVKSTSSAAAAAGSVSQHILPTRMESQLL